MNRLFLLSLLVFLSLGWTGQGWSQQTGLGAGTKPDVETEERFGDWSRLCEQVSAGGKVCGLAQNIQLKDSGQSVLKVIVRRHAEGSSILLNLPLGFSLPPGVRVQIDESEAKIHPVQTCTQGGCLVGWPVDDAYIELMKQGKAMSVTLVTLEGEPFSIPVSLNGFTKGFGTIKAS